MDYRSSGVDIDAAHDVVRNVKKLARKTFTPGVLSDIGSFGGLFQLDTKTHLQPVLVASADGVGTKLKVAFLADRHDTVGIDLVNHCVNDVLVQGARPLFFLDYLATGRLSTDVSTAVIKGLAEACAENGCALLGGETAEMPGFYADGEYDLAGFIVGVVDRDKLIDGSRIEPGDVLVGLRSAGLHTNGYSLARQILFEQMKLGVHDTVDRLGCTVGEELLRPHRSYLGLVSTLLDDYPGAVKGMAHITGGGLTDNLPRTLPVGIEARIDPSRWSVPPIFELLRREGAVPDEEMFRAFNMGIGMVIVASPEAAPAVVDRAREGAIVIGEVVKGERRVVYV